MSYIAKYPSNLASDSDLKIAVNNLSTRLRSGVTASDTLWSVTDATQITVGMLLSCDNEIVSVTSLSPFTVVRGFDDTAAVPHAANRPVEARIDAWHHNALREEIQAVQAALGPNLANVDDQPGIISTAYDFPPQAPGGALIVGNNSITLEPVPAGVNGTDSGHYLYIAGGVGTGEAVLITGGTAISGTASGTVIVTCANNHNGAWMIRSATAGIQEAINVLPADGGIVRVPAGHHTLYGPTTVKRSNVRIRGEGFYASWLETAYIGGSLFNFDGTADTGNVSLANMLEFLTIKGPNNAAASNYAVSLDGQVRFWMRYVNVTQVANGVRIVDNNNSDAISFEHVWVAGVKAAGIAYDVQGGNSQYFMFAHAVGGGTNSIGFKVSKTGAYEMHNSLSFQMGFGLQIAPGAGQSASLMWIDSSIFDTCTKDAIQIVPNGAGAVVHSVHFVNSYAAAAAQNGVYMETAGGAEIEEVNFSSGRILLNGLAGVVIRGTKIKSITFNGNAITSNSATTTGFANGIHIEPAVDGPDGLIITNNRIGIASYHAWELQYGIAFITLGAINNVIITGNIFDSKVATVGGVKQYIFGTVNMTGQSLLIKDNQPESGETTLATVSGAVLLLDGGGRTLFTCSGSGTVTSIAPGWRNREVTLRNIDAGTFNFNAGGNIGVGFNLTQNTSKRVYFDGIDWWPA